MEENIAGIILLAFGLLSVARPDIPMRFQVWSNRVIMGAQYVPSARTYTIFRFVGAFFIVMGVLVLIGVLE